MDIVMRKKAVLQYHGLDNFSQAGLCWIDHFDTQVLLPTCIARPRLFYMLHMNCQKSLLWLWRLSCSLLHCFDWSSPSCRTWVATTRLASRMQLLNSLNLNLTDEYLSANCAYQLSARC